jgi:hypothetical protein
MPSKSSKAVMWLAERSVFHLAFLLKCKTLTSVWVLVIWDSYLGVKELVIEPHNGPGVYRRPGGVGYGPRFYNLPPPKNFLRNDPMVFKYCMKQYCDKKLRKQKRKTS